MATIYNGVVFGGLGVFSKNIKYQMPHLVWQFPDIKDIYAGSIKAELDRPLHVAKYDCTTLPIPWLEVDYSGQILGWQFESFSFLEIQLEPTGGQLHRAWIINCSRQSLRDSFAGAAMTVDVLPSSFHLVLIVGR